MPDQTLRPPMLIVSPESPGAFRQVLLLALAALLGVGPFLLIGGPGGPLYREFASTTYLAFHNIVESFSVMVSLSIAGIGWFTFRQSQSRRALVLAAAFLAVGAADFMHALSFPGMPDFVTANSTSKGALLWIIARLLTAGGLLAAQLVPTDRRISQGWREAASLLALALGLIALAFVAGTYLEPALPPMFVPGVGLTLMKRLLEYVIVALFALAFVGYWREYRRMHDRMSLLCAIALALCIVSELAFTLYQSAYDSYNLLGHLYKIAGFSFIYAGTFTVSARMPYAELVRTGEQLRRDIEQRVRTEHALTESEARFRKVVEYAPDAIIATDRGGRIVLANSRASEVLGFPDLVGRPVHDLVPPRLRPFHRDACAGVPGNQPARPMALGRELFALRSDGTEIPIEASLSTIETGRSQLNLLTIRDITDRRRDEHEREEATRLIARLAATVESASDAIITRALDGTITSWNPAAERLFGYTAAEALGTDLLLVPEELREETALITESIRRGARPQVAETERLARDGRRIPVSVSRFQVRAADGELIGTGNILRDLTEHRQAQQARELARVAAARADFVRTLSHELRSPLNAILGFSELLDMDDMAPLADNQRSQVRHIQAAGRHMLSLVNDILDLSRIDAGRWDLDPRTFDVRQTIRVVVEESSAAAEQQGIALYSVLPPEPLSVTSDERSIRQILTNLVANAVKFTERGMVEVRASVEDERLVVEVADTGVGIAPDDLSVIFDEFAQVGAKRSRGSGLGLPITSRIVGLLQGSIHVDSLPGSGSTFTVRLPVVLPGSEGRADDR